MPYYVKVEEKPGTGAFEVYSMVKWHRHFDTYSNVFYEKILWWSKIESGKWPRYHELVDRIVSFYSELKSSGYNFPELKAKYEY